MEEFTLLVDGRHVDTGLYEYFPYADSVITDFKETYRTIIKLQQNKPVENVEKYIFAKYSIGTNTSNSEAIMAAYNASKIFKQFPVSKRLNILHDIHKHLVANKDKFIELLTIEGHPRRMAEWEYNCMELGYRKESLELFKDELWKAVGKYKNENLYWARKADGVIALATPKNASASNSLTGAYALLGGNTIIVKPPLKAPIATIFLWKEVVNKALTDNNAPAGTVNIVLGNSKKIFEEWLASPYVNDILFFGDSKTGIEIGQRCYSCGKKPILELSGNDMLFVWKECDIEGATNAATESFVGSTQICMVPKTIIVHQDILEQFIEVFLHKAATLHFGLPSDPDTIFTPVIKMEEYQIFLKDALDKGAKLIYGGNKVNHRGEVDAHGQYLQPTILLIDNEEVARTMLCVTEENFFPLLPIVKVSSNKSGQEKDKDIFQKCMSFAASNEYGLRTSVWVNSYLYTRLFVKHLDTCGILRINSSHVALSPYLSSHGGIKKTGGPTGEMNYMWQKTTHLQGISLTRERRKKPR